MAPSFNKVGYFLFTFCSLFVFLWSGMALAQRIKIAESAEKIGEQPLNGMFVVLELDKKYVEKAWLAFVKTYGKSEKKGDLVNVPAATMTTLSQYPCKIYSTLQSHSDGTKVWWAIDLTSFFVTSAKEKEYAEASKLLYSFAVSAYRDDINRQISDAEDALEKAVNKQEKEVSEGIRLTEKQKDNAKEKVDLLDKQKQNKEDYQRINREIDFSLKEQTVVLDKIHRIKREHDESHSDKVHQQLQDAINDQQKHIRQIESLTRDLDKSKRTKVDLETKLKKNEDEKVLLEQELEQNKTDQVAAAAEVEQLKKAVDQVKAKLQRIEN